VPWHRRPEAARLLDTLKDSSREWSAVVVGEGTRCWFGNQFSLIAPRLAGYGVDLWVPELGGRFEPRNPSHTMLMSLLGGMSESERQHVQARARAAMVGRAVWDDPWTPDLVARVAAAIHEALLPRTGPNTSTNAKH
jgi:DNA invertase Pin-like site-specific DNA recombinase